MTSSLTSMQQRYLIVIISLTVPICVSDNFCAKRYIKGKWETNGNCPGVRAGDIITPPKRVDNTRTKSYFPKSCQDVDLDQMNMKGSDGGVVHIYPRGLGEADVYCDFKTDGGGWTVFQRRKDGRTDFYRNWNEYKVGFGNLKAEFWLGLDLIHKLTKTKDYELRVDMITRNGTYIYAKYGSFSLGGLNKNYSLSVGDYSGNATDSLRNHNKRQFSTKDVDNDTSNTTSCAQTYKGAWWYQNCYDSNLNGKYWEDSESGVSWWHKEIPKNLMILTFTEMKFRKRN